MRTIIINLRLFWQGTILSYIALFNWLQPVTYMASLVVGPIFQLLFFSLLGSFATGAATISFYVVGNAVQTAAMSGIYGVTMSIGGDRWNGTVVYLFGTPANRLVMFFGRAFMHVLNGFFGVAMAFMWGVLLLGLDLSRTNLAALALTILITTISTSAMGLLMGCLGLITVNIMFINNFIYFALLIFSGANVRLETLPGWVQVVSSALPLTRGIAAARLLVGGAAFADVVPLLLGELAVGAAYSLLGYFLFAWFEYQAKRLGTLEAI